RRRAFHDDGLWARIVQRFGAEDCSSSKEVSILAGLAWRPRRRRRLRATMIGSGCFEPFTGNRVINMTRQWLLGCCLVLTQLALAGCGSKHSGGGVSDAGLTDSSTPDGSGPCTDGQQVCGLRCVDTNLDPKNCGKCGKACALGEMCSMGTCGATCMG